MVGDGAYALAVFASALWFGAAFRYFSYQHWSAAKVLVPTSARQSPLFVTVGALVRFLGGMNAALSLLSVTLFALWISDAGLFNSPAERCVLLAVLGAAHLSQFAFNLPVLLQGERQGEALWPVLSGPMWFIFRMDAAQSVLCWLAAAAQLLAV